MFGQRRSIALTAVTAVVAILFSGALARSFQWLLGFPEGG
jgi:hypothetical protein